MAVVIVVTLSFSARNTAEVRTLLRFEMYR
jgi:hypothetical protein